MRNWSTDVTELKKDKEKYAVWCLEQTVNFGLGNEKLSSRLLKKYWNLLNIDPDKKKYLEMLLWGGKRADNK